MAYHSINKKTNNNSNNNGSGNNNGNIGSNPGIPIQNAQNVITNDVPELLIDYSKLAKKKKISKVLFRDSVVEKMLTVLQTTKHPNPLMLGEAGTGKTSIVEHLAVLLYEKNNLVTSMIDKDTKIYELPLANLIAGSGIFGELEEKLMNVIDFISNPKNKAILYIDEIHQLQTNHSLKSVAEILKPALGRGDMRLIGATTTQELKHLKQNNALMRRFSKVNIDELSNEQTFQVLKAVEPSLQNGKTHVGFSDDLLHYAIKVGNDNAKLLESARPDTSITILDQAFAYARLQSIKLAQLNTQIAPNLSKNTIDASVKQLINSENVNINMQSSQQLSDKLDNSIIGQDEAKKQLIKTTSSIALDLRQRKKPHSFLFAGPSGVGKTEIAKCLAETLFGSKEEYININMTEFAHDASLTNLIGSSRGYIGSDSTQPLPLDPLKTKPFQIVLLDEIEKSSRAVKQIFMQALDEGYIQYADNSYVDFSKAIVIATTNAGMMEMEKPTIGFGGQKTKPSDKDLTEMLKNDFPVELLNRFEHKIQFESITKDDYAEILVIKYHQIIKEIKEQHPEYDFEPQVADKSMDFIQHLADKSYNSLLNGRPAERTMSHHIEDIIIDNPTARLFNINQIK